MEALFHQDSGRGDCVSLAVIVRLPCSCRAREMHTSIQRDERLPHRYAECTHRRALRYDVHVVYPGIIVH